MIYRQIAKTDVISTDPEVMSGTPVFRGTRVPVITLFDYLKAGDPLAEFLDDFPTVSRQQAEDLLELTKQSIVQ
jgi:uncharacterized protein (DUF433 family)